MSMSKRLNKALATDPQLERDGIKYEVYDAEGVIAWFILARAGGANKSFLAALDRRIKPFRRAWDNEMVPLDKKVEVVKQTICEACIKSWGSTEHGEGKVEVGDQPVALSYDNALALMTEQPNLYEDILDIVQKSGNYRREAVASDVGKS